MRTKVPYINLKCASVVYCGYKMNWARLLMNPGSCFMQLVSNISYNHWNDE